LPPLSSVSDKRDAGLWSTIMLKRGLAYLRDHDQGAEPVDEFWGLLYGLPSLRVTERSFPPLPNERCSFATHAAKRRSFHAVN
jgi:hypothetical protein